MDDLYEIGARAIPDHGHPRLPSLSATRSDAMPDTTPDTTPDLPALPVTFRPGRTRAVLVVLAVATFAAITAVGMLLDGLGAGSASASC